MNIAMFDIIDQWHAGTLRSILPETELHHTLKTTSSRIKTVRADYIPCITPVGHATLSTGSNPKDHQIIGRSWWTTETGPQIEVSIEDLFDLLLYGNASPFSFPNYIRDKNLCRSLEGWFSIIVAAKDFVPLILGGDVADIQIFPWIGPNGWELNIRSLDQQFVDPNIQAEIIGVLSHAGIRATYGGWDSARRCHFFDLPGFNLLSVNPLDVDKIYSECVKLFLQKAHDSDEIQNILFCQSFYSTDWVGHEVGPSNTKYNNTLREVFEIIANQIYFAKELSEHDNFVGLITTDHGSRDVDNLMKMEVVNAQLNYLEFEPGPRNIGNDISLFTSISRSSPDVLYWYNTPSGDDVNRHGYSRINHQRFNIPSDILRESFQSHNQPAIIEVADSNKYFYPDIYRDVWRGSHGASVRDSNKPYDLNPDDYTIPYIFFRFPTLEPTENLLKDVGISTEPKYHFQLRDVFLSLIGLFSSLSNRPLATFDPEAGGLRMLSLHGLSQQCQLLEKVYKRVAEELRLDHDLLNYLTHYISLELKNKELSFASKLLLIYVKTDSTHPEYGGIRQIIRSPSDFEGKLSPEESVMMDSLKRFSDITQILSEIKTLGDALTHSKSADDAANALEAAAKRLKKKAIEIEKLLA